MVEKLRQRGALSKGEKYATKGQRQERQEKIKEGKIMILLKSEG